MMPDMNEDNRRKDIMTPEQMERTDEYVDWYKGAWLDKDDRGLFAKWQKMETYWEGDVNYSDDASDPGSNSNVVNANIEGQVALMGEKEPTLTLTPQEQSDVAFAEAAQTIGNFIIEKNKPARMLDMAYRRYKKFGLAVFTVIFDPDKLDGFGLPLIQNWNPAYVFFDHNITDVSQIQEGRFVIATRRKSLKWAGKMFGEDKANAIRQNYSPIEDEAFFDEDANEAQQSTVDNYIHMFVFTKCDGKVRLEQISACGVLLWDSEEEGMTLPDDKFPFFVCADQPRESTTYARSGTESILPTQDLINDLDDQIRINARLMGNIQKVVGTGSGIDIDKWTNEPGLNIPSSNPDEFRIVQPANMPQYITERRNQAFFSERQVLSRFSDQMAGIRQPGVDTATEALALHQSGMAGVDRDKMMFQETLSELMEYCLDLVSLVWTEEHAFRLTGKDSEFLWFKASDLRKTPKMTPADEKFISQWREKFPGKPAPDHMLAESGGEPVYKEASFDIKINIGAGLPANKAFRYTATKEAYLSGAMTPEEYRQRLREYGILPEISWEHEQAILQALQQQQQQGDPERAGQQPERPARQPSPDVEGAQAEPGYGTAEDMTRMGGESRGDR